ncbi:MAG: glycosyltransferase family 2 protein [Hyphomonas sp.]|uniref:glycosyltransferase family 2 protein n=3 Tax=Hyphomonas sp. TaxID=87 RepID=UPI003266BBF4
MHSTSVVIPTYNRASLLADTLNSVLAQTRQPDEILLIDDGSTDDTPAIAARYPQVRYVRTENQGKSAAINHAMTLMTGTRLWVVDDDDIVCPDALAKLSAALEANPSAGFSYGRHDRFTDPADGGARVWQDTGYWRDCHPRDFLIATMEDMFTHQSGMLFDKTLLDAIGPFNTGLRRSVDYDYILRAARISTGAACPSVVFHQRQHDGDRGAGANKFPVSELVRRWIQHDQIIFGRIHDSWPLDEFLPRGETIDGPSSRRQALIQRGVVMARKKLWDLAMQDFALAATLMERELSDTERRLVRRGTQSKYGIQELLDNHVIGQGLRDVASLSSVGAELIGELATGFRWRIRDELTRCHPRTASRLLQLYITLTSSAFHNPHASESPWYSDDFLATTHKSPGK